MKLLLIQYGDYYKALKSRDSCEPETYRAQYQSLEAIDTIVNGNSCMVICLENNKRKGKFCSKKNIHIQKYTYKNYQIIYGNFLPSPTKNISLKNNFIRKAIDYLRYAVFAKLSTHRIKKIAQDFAPSHIIIRTSGWILGDMGTWAIKNKIHLLPLLADYEEQKKGLKKWIPLRHLEVLRSKKIPLVCNHNYPACESLVNAGVPASKIVPWDWTSTRNPTHGKKHKDFLQGNNVNKKTVMKKHYSSQSKNKKIQLLYAGLLQHNKGVGDILHALAILRHEKNNTIENPFNIHLSICGTGPHENALRKLGESLGLCGLHSEQDIVHFCGMQSNDQVWAQMQSARAVIVPSWHSYPEGMPNVIYEAFEAYTPVIVSDHPSFLGRLQHGKGCMIFQAQQSNMLARAIWEMGQDIQYSRVSDGIVDAWKAIQCPVSFKDALHQWKEYTLLGKSMPCLQYAIKNSTTLV